LTDARIFTSGGLNLLFGMLPPFGPFIGTALIV